MNRRKEKAKIPFDLKMARSCVCPIRIRTLSLNMKRIENPCQTIFQKQKNSVIVSCLRFIHGALKYTYPIDSSVLEDPKAFLKIRRKIQAPAKPPNCIIKVKTGVEKIKINFAAKTKDSCSSHSWKITTFDSRSSCQALEETLFELIFKTGGDQTEDLSPKIALGYYELVFDAVYTPKITRLLREAGEMGAKIVTGVEMFISQAYEQYERFTGLPAPKQLFKEIMKDY
ncbi:shikimate dehydrogenase [Striga asiatica]|uniref:Shikimate dehydrogenase n=1 Tax=Striga asiatica TaxID=4170 RepID=A0A5A7QG28_STRAF|nr:shikimate dehydrogenase [Striga asiatica]